MILGVGTDLCDLRRIERICDRYGDRFLHRVFTPEERQRAQRRNPVATLGKRWAAKEACVKALGTGLRMGIAWNEMGVINLPSGQPTLRLHGSAARRLADLTPAGHQPHIHLSLTDEPPYAHAVVTIEALPEDSPQ